MTCYYSLGKGRVWHRFQAVYGRLDHWTNFCENPRLFLPPFATLLRQREDLPKGARVCKRCEARG